MKSFDEWYREARKVNDFGFTDKDFYEAGAESRQAEIDELQAMYEKQGLYAFELQKRIDKLIPLLERYNYAGWIKILKGNQDE